MELLSPEASRKGKLPSRTGSGLKYWRLCLGLKWFGQRFLDLNGNGFTAHRRQDIEIRVLLRMTQCLKG